MARAGARARALLQHLAVKLVLSAAIILSLIPPVEGEVGRTVDLAFLVIFSVEFALRLLTLYAPPRPDERRLTTFLLLVTDFVALLTFIPWSDARALRLARLLRILMLVGFWAPTVRDVGHVLSREERLRQIALMGFAVASLSFCGAVILDSLTIGGIDFDSSGAVEGEDGSFLVRLWWAFRQVQDPGNMLASPSNVVAIFVSLALTVFGLFLVSFLIGLGTNVVSELVDLSRNRPPGLRGHTVLVRMSPATRTLLAELENYHRRLFRRRRYAIISPEGRPEFLVDPRIGKVVYRQGDPTAAGALERVDTVRAKRIVVSADLDSDHADADTTGIVLKAREANPRALLIVETLDDTSARALRVAGGPRTVLVPFEKLLALILAATVAQPGLERLLDMLLGSAGREVYSYLFTRPDSVTRGERLALHRPMGFDALVARGVAGSSHGRVVPIGVVRFAGDDKADWDVVLNAQPSPDDDIPARSLAGVVCVAESFEAAEGFAENLVGDLPETAGAPARPIGLFRPAGMPATLKTVLVCGIRPATLDLIEDLMLAWPGVEVTLLARSDQAWDRLQTALRERGLARRRGVGSARGLWTRETRADPREGVQEWTLRDEDGESMGRMVAEAADWTADTTLARVPATGRHVGQHDMVAFLGGLGPHADGHISVAVLKVAELRQRTPDRFHSKFRVVATVRDPDLGRLLERRFCQAANTHSERIRVLATRQLRAHFAFQSLAVPGFAQIYGLLLDPAKPSFYRLVPPELDEAGRREAWTFGQLVASLRLQGCTLVAVELADGEGCAPELWICPDAGREGDAFTLDQLRAVWVVAEGGKFPKSPGAQDVSGAPTG